MLTVVLCGGKGERLGLADKPKCMAEVAGRPFIDWKLDNLEALGHRDLLLLTGHLGDQIEDHVTGFACWRDAGMGRGLALHEAPLPPWFWLTYGDTLLDYDREAVEAVHLKTGKPVMTMWNNRDYGAMILPARAFAKMTTFGLAIKRLNPVPFKVSEPWHHINTPADLAECEAFLCASV